MKAEAAERYARHFAQLSLPITSGWAEVEIGFAMRKLEALREVFGIGKLSFLDVIKVGNASAEIMKVIEAPGRATHFIRLHIELSRLITEAVEKATPPQVLAIEDLENDRFTVRNEHLDSNMFESLRGHARLYEGWDFRFPWGTRSSDTKAFLGFWGFQPKEAGGD